MKSKDNAFSVKEHIPDDEAACCGKKDYLFLFPPRSSFFEVIFVVFLTGLYTSLMAYFMHSTTLTLLNPWLTPYDRQVFFGLTLATIFLSSSSLLSRPIPESTPYLTNDSFSIFSSHYQRVGYSVLILGFVCITEFGASYQGTLFTLLNDNLFQAAYIVNFIALVL
jgi:hypothetical protein